MTPIFSFPPITEEQIAEHFAQAEGEYACYGAPIRACLRWAEGPICLACLASTGERNAQGRVETTEGALRIPAGASSAPGSSLSLTLDAVAGGLSSVAPSCADCSMGCDACPEELPL